MKTFVLLFSLLAFSTITFAQQSYTFENEELTLKTEVNGALDLLWNTFNGEFRYFVKNQDEKLIELKNTKGSDNKYNNAHQNTLKSLTGEDASQVNLTLHSLKQFINAYNATQDSNYSVSKPNSKLDLRLGVFGGATNSPFSNNPSNIKSALFGAELEAVSNQLGSRHAGFINARHNFKSDDFNYSATQFALGYRYRFVTQDRFNIYAQTKFATLTISKVSTTLPDPNNPGKLMTIKDKSTGFNAPLIFGLGADVRLGNGYLTIVYDSLFALFIKNEGNFPVDFALGYKFNL